MLKAENSIALKNCVTKTKVTVKYLYIALLNANLSFCIPKLSVVFIVIYSMLQIPYIRINCVLDIPHGLYKT